MFDSICVAQDDFQVDSIDFGRLAEALVFYRRVHIVANHATFSSLVRTCGADALFELCQMGNLQIHYAENLTGVGTLNGSTPLERHGLVCIKGENQSFQNDATKLFQEYCGSSGKGLSKNLRRFSKIAKVFEYPRSTLDHVQSDLTDTRYVRACAAGILSRLAPEYGQPHPLIFDIFPDSKKELRVETNIDFVAANASYHKRVSPSYGQLSNAFLLAAILTCRGSIEIASTLSSDLLLGPTGQVIAANKIGALLESRDTHQAGLDRFTEFAVDGTGSIADVVNKKERGFDEVLNLVVEAQRFKEWLAKQDESTDLCAEYCREVSKVGWADKLPTKTTRWLLINTAAVALSLGTSPIVGIGAGLAINAADAFLLDNMLRGWRPNQFVDGPLKKFIEES